MAFLATLPTLPANVQVEHFDASYLSLVIGGVTTGIFVAIIFMVVGYFLVKYKIVVIGTPTTIVPIHEDDHSAVQNRIICDPEKCVALMKVRQQQERNVKDINGVVSEVHSLTDLFFKKLNFIQTQNNVLLRAAVKNNQLSESDIPKEAP